MKLLTNKLIFLPLLIILLFLVVFVSKTISNPKNITEQQAINTVKSLSEVKKYFKEGSKDIETFIKAEERKNNYWYIQVGSITPATEGIISHSATFNWYKLDKKTGKIACSLFLYDKNGKFLGSGETKKLCL